MVSPTDTQYPPFPDSPRVIYARNPIDRVICQLRFPTILQIRSADPADFQEKVRSGYPLYQLDSAGQLPAEVADMLSKFPVSQALERHNHVFSTEDSERSITLSANSISLSEHSYERWDQFREELELAIKSVEETYHPTFYTRVGLRYTDIIDREELDLDMAWHDLINRELIGVLGAEQLRERTQESEAVAMFSLGDIVPGAFARVRHGLVKSEDAAEVYQIDADYFTAERSEDVLGILDEFNRLAGNLFRWAITERLQNALGRQPIN